MFIIGFIVTVKSIFFNIACCKHLSVWETATGEAVTAGATAATATGEALDKHDKTNVKGINADESNYSYGRGGNGIHSYLFSTIDW